MGTCDGNENQISISLSNPDKMLGFPPGSWGNLQLHLSIKTLLHHKTLSLIQFKLLQLFVLYFYSFGNKHVFLRISAIVLALRLSPHFIYVSVVISQTLVHFIPTGEIWFNKSLNVGDKFIFSLSLSFGLNTFTLRRITINDKLQHDLGWI